ncbi:MULTISPECIES: DUF3916 domain-containing protein [Tenebrionibacter/Tenebrionicola group]|jgi:hypothetical protein|uniref:DUF3916 domain-containing protein n=2 Tax=Tenebrionibacter/Tenebrionicola group TaxID=2969848 RepID=A0A8K0V5F4_9ENTR|nr:MULTISPECIES: DUF3916 domain-containing protein [Tenebrionibacter/Tenebrionicola group]MBK4717146.1 DUF3916 domain-containing protein [Tenebrionibacter intestinalis]MBV4413116.1 DUF3916 domain-containing protein [Tenebrionicola larvae]MBV5097670.1 DUF3916 domain-containing protein [Tenebrionicola larvae]
MRQLAISNKKLRGIPRRLRALKKWAETYDSRFPVIADEDYSYGYWNDKIPVHFSLVQGKQTNRNIQSYCAQMLIDAAYDIYQSKPADKKNIRVTCSIVLPDMFSSELCLFTSEDYFNMHTQPGNNIFGQLSLLHGRSLVKEWDLVLPNDFSELGILRVCENDEGEIYYSEHWYIGEVSKK